MLSPSLSGLSLLCWPLHYASLPRPNCDQFVGFLHPLCRLIFWDSNSSHPFVLNCLHIPIDLYCRASPGSLLHSIILTPNQLPLLPVPSDQSNCTHPSKRVETSVSTDLKKVDNSSHFDVVFECFRLYVMWCTLINRHCPVFLLHVLPTYQGQVHFMWSLKILIHGGLVLVRWTRRHSIPA